MKKIIHLASLISFSLMIVMLAACGGDSDGAASEATEENEVALPAGDAEHGEEIYSTTCFGCHGPSGEGVTGLGKDLTTSSYIVDNSDADLVDFLKTGRPVGDPLNTTGVDMPPKGGNPSLDDEDLQDLVAYMRSIAK